MLDKSKNQGRKTGKKTKSAFDRHKRKIFKELELGIPKVKILEKLKQIDINLEKITIQALTAYIKRKIISKNKPSIQKIQARLRQDINKKNNYYKFIKELEKVNINSD
jgi:hypothetical protein